TSIRGISSNVGLESAIAIHLDGVYLGDRFDQTRAFYDVERVEVLRGPQGTLYGRNATGGAINVISREPTEEAEAELAITVGNYERIETEGFVSGGLGGDRVLGRFAFKTVNFDGYGENAFNGESLHGDDAFNLRGKLVLLPSDSLAIKLSADYAQSETNFQNQVSRLFPDQPLVTELLDPTFAPATGFDGNTNRPDAQDTEVHGVSARVEWDLGFASLTSITGYREMNREEQTDIDGSPLDQAYFRLNERDSNQISQEFNLAGDISDRLSWLVGAFYYNSEQDFLADVPIPGLELILGLPPGALDLTVSSDYEIQAYAGYGELRFDVNDRLNVTLGGRYSTEKHTNVEFDGRFGTANLEDDWNDFTPRIAISYDATDNINLYATYSEGFKSGGFDPATFNLVSFNPEQVKNYEAGIKSRLLGNRLEANAAVFSMDYTDLQVQRYTIRENVPALQVENAAEATINGLEADLRFLASEHWSFDANLSYLDATYDDYLAADQITTEATGEVTTRDVSGNQLFDAPEFAANLGTDLSAPIWSDWEARLRAEAQYQSEVFFTPFEDLRGLSQDAVTIGNLRATFANEALGAEIAAFVYNISDEEVISSQTEGDDTPFTGAFVRTTFKSPRTYGVTIRKSF
ncbi:MAG: TonB-dependent receptor, partial [Caulobacterales bacterium]|nr:TonB-dependent receptor [Caulobacterales bacterium]